MAVRQVQSITIDPKQLYCRPGDKNTNPIWTNQPMPKPGCLYIYTWLMKSRLWNLPTWIFKPKECDLPIRHLCKRRCLSNLLESLKNSLRNYITVITMVIFRSLEQILHNLYVLLSWLWEDTALWHQHYLESVGFFSIYLSRRTSKSSTKLY